MSIEDRLQQAAARSLSVFHPMKALPGCLEEWKDRSMIDLAVAILRLEHQRGNDKNLKTLIHFNQQVISACQEGHYDKVNNKLVLLEKYMRKVVKIGNEKRFHFFYKKGIDLKRAEIFERQLHTLKKYEDILQSRTIINKYEKIRNELVPERAKGDREYE